MNVCLVILFNHRFDENIEKLRKIYSSRFSLIRFIVPFYDGSDKDVFSVYESSYQFQGYIAQSREKLMLIDCDGYFFIADDMLLNPLVNEINLLQILGDEGKLVSHCSNMVCLPQMASSWVPDRIWGARNCFYSQHTNFAREIFDAEQAFVIARNNGYDNFKIDWRSLGGFSSKKDKCKWFLRKILIKNKIECLPYPLMCAYSDWFILSKEDFPEVSRAFGVTAAMGLFVEIAVPTVMALYCKNLKTEEKMKLKGKALWGKEIEQLEIKYNFDYRKLVNDFPDDQLYIHPVKLSQWK